MRPIPALLVTAIIATLAATGCLRRIEIIDIAADGSATLITAFEGEPEDVRTGSAAPTAAGGWIVEQREEKDGENTKLIVTARQTLPPGAALPEMYAPPGSATAALDLRLTTTVRTERRPEGTYYHFARRYHPRRWAQFDYFHETLIKSSDLRELAEKDPKELTDEDRTRLAEKLIQVEALKTAEFLSAASAGSSNISLDARLRVQLAVHPLFSEADLQTQTIALLSGNADDGAAAQLEARIDRDVRAAIERVLGESKVAQGAIDGFLRAYDNVRAEYRLSEDLGDEQWGVAVRMPGRIIAHNCFDASSQPSETASAEPDLLKGMLASDVFPQGPDRVGWRFDGPALYDREVVLMATSFVPAKEK